MYIVSLLLLNLFYIDVLLICLSLGVPTFSCHTCTQLSLVASCSTESLCWLTGWTRTCSLKLNLIRYTVTLAIVEFSTVFIICQIHDPVWYSQARISPSISKITFWIPSQKIVSNRYEICCKRECTRWRWSLLAAYTENLQLFSSLYIVTIFAHSNQVVLTPLHYHHGWAHSLHQHFELHKLEWQDRH